MLKKSRYRVLLAAASAFLIIFGFINLGLMLWPVIINFTSDFNYRPQLPIAEAIDDNVAQDRSNKGRQSFPPIETTGDVAPGNWIRLPSLNVNVPLASSSSIADSDILNTLSQGAALYPNGVKPGRPGNVFIAAHSTGEPWKGKYRFAFLSINELSVNNLIHLDYEGTRYTYRVVSQEVVKPSPDYQIVSDRPVPTITLMACWPLWSTSSRMLITGELTNITKLTAEPN